ncbi:MAG: hypothetical protein P8Y45_18620 [Exilibacterium sp.]
MITKHFSDRYTIDKDKVEKDGNQTFTSWAELVEKGDGYLTPHQRQTFEQAFALISRQMENTLTSQSEHCNSKPLVEFDELQDRFLETAGESELDQDAALAAYRVLSYLANEFNSTAH